MASYIIVSSIGFIIGILLILVGIICIKRIGSVYVYILLSFGGCVAFICGLSALCLSFFTR